MTESRSHCVASPRTTANPKPAIEGRNEEGMIRGTGLLQAIQSPGRPVDKVAAAFGFVCSSFSLGARQVHCEVDSVLNPSGRREQNVFYLLKIILERVVSRTFRTF